MAFGYGANHTVLQWLTGPSPICTRCRFRGICRALRPASGWIPSVAESTGRRYGASGPQRDSAFSPRDPGESRLSPRAGITLRSGRDFDDRDGAADGPASIIIDETFARRFWPRETAVLGKRVSFLGANPKWMTVIGVVESV